MTNSTIYVKGSQQVNELLSNKSPKKVLIVPIDFAKNKHVAKICDASGQYLHRKPMILHNHRKGLEYLVDRIKKSCSRRAIKEDSVIISCEDPHSYAKPFMQALKDLGYLVVQVNAHKAKTLRSNGMASSDELDLDGITNAVLNRHATDLKGQDSTYAALNDLSRSYHNDVKQATRMKNQITKLMDQLFPHFLNRSKTGLEPFGRASIALMKRGLSARKMKCMKRQSLENQLKKFHLKGVNNIIDKLKEVADVAFVLDSGSEESLLGLLKIKIELLESLELAQQQTLELCKDLLIKTPYCLTMSIPGIASKRAITLAGEFGSPGTLRKSKSMCAYAGIVPKTTQSGGPDKAPAVIGLPKKANRRLKNVLLGAAFDQGQYTHSAGRFIPRLRSHRLREHFIKVESEGGRSGISTAKLLTKIIRRMVKDNTIYLPQKQDLSPDELAIYVQTSLNQVYNYFGKELFDSTPENENILLQVGRQWQQTFKDFYDIDLELPF